MAFYDWNNDGKKDMQDDFIEYNIYKNSTGKTGNTSRNHSSGGMSTFWAVICTIGILLFIGWIIGLSEPKCAHSGCDNSPADGSSYCWLHKSSSSSGYKSNNYNKSTSSPSSNGSSSQSNNNNTSTSNSTSTSSSTNKNSSTGNNKSNGSKSTYNSSKSDDPYNAKDYGDAEDFYDDNYDDFDEYEDAEDYYDEWGE